MIIGNILAHRGCWKIRSEMNTDFSLFSAVKEGFGIETDIRDALGSLVISHDPPNHLSVLKGESLFQECERCNSSGRLALNIKSDGLQEYISLALAKSGISTTQIFAFDMAIPDALGFARAGLPFYTRTSEFELDPCLLDLAQGVWIDDFSGSFHQVEAALRYSSVGKRVALVSPELHGRDHRRTWDAILAADLHRNPIFELCTDLPHQAFAVFGTTP